MSALETNHTEQLMIIVVFGLPGSGKSYFSRELANRMGAHYYNSDIIRQEVVKNMSYSESEKHRVYEIMFARSLEQIDKEESVILDATFYREELRQRLSELASSYGISPIFIEVKASEESIRKRLGTKRPFSDADFSVYEKIKAQFEPFEDKHLVLDSDLISIEAMVEEAMQYINGQYDPSGS